MILAKDRQLLEKYEFEVSILRKGGDGEASLKVIIDRNLPYHKVFHPKLIQALIDAIKRTEDEVAEK